MSSRVDRINSSIRDFETVPGVEGAALVSLDGLMISSALPESEQERVAAISAAMLSLGERVIEEMRKGRIERVFVEGSEGTIISMNAGPNAVLTCSSRKDAKLGLIFLESPFLSPFTLYPSGVSRLGKIFLPFITCSKTSYAFLF